MLMFDATELCPLRNAVTYGGAALWLMAVRFTTTACAPDGTI